MAEHDGDRRTDAGPRGECRRRQRRFAGAQTANPGVRAKRPIIEGCIAGRETWTGGRVAAAPAGCETSPTTPPRSRVTVGLARAVATEKIGTSRTPAAARRRGLASGPSRPTRRLSPSGTRGIVPIWRGEPSRVGRPIELRNPPESSRRPLSARSRDGAGAASRDRGPGRELRRPGARLRDRALRLSRHSGVGRTTTPLRFVPVPWPRRDQGPRALASSWRREPHTRKGAICRASPPAVPGSPNGSPRREPLRPGPRQGPVTCSS